MFRFMQFRDQSRWLFREINFGMRESGIHASIDVIIDQICDVFLSPSKGGRDVCVPVVLNYTLFILLNH